MRRSALDETFDEAFSRAMETPGEHAHAARQGCASILDAISRQLLFERLLEKIPEAAKLPSWVVLEFTEQVAADALGEGARIFAGLRRSLDTPRRTAPVGFTELRELTNLIMTDGTKEAAAFQEAAAGDLYEILSAVAAVQTDEACELHPLFDRHRERVAGWVFAHLERGAMTEFCLEWLTEAADVES